MTMSIQIGTHTKATMFNMDTRSKITPRPAPSLMFLSKNFNDGLDETDTTNNDQTPSFLSLGLGSDSEIDMKTKPLKAYHPDPNGKDQVNSSPFTGFELMISVLLFRGIFVSNKATFS